MTWVKQIPPDAMCLTYPGLGPTLTHMVDSEKKEKLMGITCLEWEGDDFKDSRSRVWANGLLPSQQDIFGKCSEEKKKDHVLWIRF